VERPAPGVRAGPGKGDAIHTVRAGGGSGPPTVSGDGFGPGTPSLLRALNERSILRVIEEVGPVSRAQLARQMGLSKPTVSRRWSAWGTRGSCARSGGPRAAAGGRAVLYELHPRAGWVVGLDVGEAGCGRRSRTSRARSRRGATSGARVRSARSLISRSGRWPTSWRPRPGCGGTDVTQAVVGQPRCLRADPRTGGPGPQPPRLGARRAGRGGPRGARHRRGVRERREPGGARRAVARPWARAWTTSSSSRWGPGSASGSSSGASCTGGANGFAGEVGYLPIGRRRAGPPLRAAAGRVRGRGRGGRGGPLRPRLGLDPPLTAKKVFVPGPAGGPAGAADRRGRGEPPGAGPWPRSSPWWIPSW
jgi:hypothetical protein